MASNQIIVHGAHITENLQHHKATDVRRILEEKGFKEESKENGTDSAHFYPPAGTPADGKRTVISFDDDFVAEDGVSHTD